MMLARWLATALLLALPAAPALSQQQRTYTLYVAAESDDVVEKIAFGPQGFVHVKSIPVGVWPTEIEGPHGLAVAPDGAHWYVTLAHGNPYGRLFKYDTATDTYVADVVLGLFPASMSIAPSTGLLFAVNFNLHGDHVPSTVSVVETESMTEVAQIPTGTMPHGSRTNALGSRQYSVSMMDDELREIDAYTLRNSRVLPLSEIAPSWTHYQQTGNGLLEPGDAMAGMDHSSHGVTPAPIVKPTWATQPSPQGKVYVAGNGNATIHEVDLESWTVARTFGPTARGPYNIDISADGTLLVVTYKADRAVGVFSTETGAELARIPTLRPVPHGVVITPDGRYAFISIEGIGGEPGSVEAIDLQTLQRVGNIDLAKQAGGIALWKVQ